MLYGTIGLKEIQTEFDQKGVVILRFDLAQGRKVLALIKRQEWHASLLRKKGWLNQLKYYWWKPFIQSSRSKIKTIDPIASDLCEFYTSNRSQIAALECAVDTTKGLQIIIKSKSFCVERQQSEPSESTVLH